MKTLTLDLETLSVDSFDVGAEPIVPAEGGESDFTLCTACPTNQFSCMETCRMSCAGSCFLKAC